MSGLKNCFMCEKNHSCEKFRSKKKKKKNSHKKVKHRKNLLNTSVEIYKKEKLSDD